MELLAKTLYGLEEVLAKELQNLGAEKIAILKRAVSFTGDKKLLYQANLHLRTALKILMPIHSFKINATPDLYKGVQKINWSKYMNVDDTLTVDPVVNSQIFNHSGFVALKTKDAIVDQFRQKFNQRPSVDTQHPKLRINVHISNNKCTISIDSSGESLNKRGYRSRGSIAPMNEVLAAGMILLTEWNRTGLFIDPMCGSGTILIEAAMLAYNIAPGIIRKEFAFEHWQDFDSSLWQKVLEEAKQQQISPHKSNCKIIGGDSSRRAIDIAKENILNSTLNKVISIKSIAFEKHLPDASKGIIVTNPPYGERLKTDNINAFYKTIGDNLKQNFKGFEAWILSSNKEAIKKIGLRPSKKTILFNGALECKLLKYDLYAGSKKKIKNY